MARMLGTHILLHPIVLETLAAGATEPTEQELKQAGFCVALRRPKAKDLLIFDRHGDNMVAASTEMIERLSNLDEIEVANLDGQDFGELGNLLGRFAPAGQPTGTTSSAGSPPPLPSSPPS